MKHTASFVVLALLFMVSRATAQVFGPNILVTADSQVLDSGTFSFAFDVENFLLSGPPTTVNDVEFSAAGYGSSLDIAGFGGVAMGPSAASTMSASFGSVLSFALTSNSGEIRLNGLTSGQTYQLQLFAGLDGQSGSETVSDGGKTGVLAYDGSGTYSITETFVAMDSTEAIDFAPIGDGGKAVLNALNLREEPDAVPEPSIVALFFAGGLLAAGLAEGRRLALAR